MNTLKVNEAIDAVEAALQDLIKESGVSLRDVLTLMRAGPLSVDRLAPLANRRRKWGS